MTEQMFSRRSSFTDLDRPPPQLRLALERTQTAETHAQAVTTAAPKARLSQPTWFPDAIPAKPARKMAPVASEYAAQPRAPWEVKQRAKTTQPAIRHRKPMPPATRWPRPCQVMVVGGPAGVPGGKPWAGSAVRRPAATRPAP
jgi:hypothetical protein